MKKVYKPTIKKSKIWQRLHIPAIITSLCIGIFIGILIQWGHIPGMIITTVYSHASETSTLETTNNETAGNNTILATVSHNNTVILKTRKFTASVDLENYDTEMDSTYTYNEIEVDLDATAVILIDVWQSHPNDGWLERIRGNIQTRIVPLLELAREHKLRIIHVPYSKEISDMAQPLPDELVVESQADLMTYLESNHIKTLIYAGYASNWCLLVRPAGVMWMWQLGYEIILLRDCTLAFEMPETLEGEWANTVTINLIELHYGVTTTLDDLKDALVKQKTEYWENE